MSFNVLGLPKMSIAWIMKEMLPCKQCDLVSGTSIECIVGRLPVI